MAPNRPAGYSALWMLWLSAVPYGLWSESIAGPSVDENRTWIARLEETFQDAIDHFGLTLRAGTTVADLAVAVAGIVEGLWLNQCLTDPPSDRSVRADRDRHAPFRPPVVARRDAPPRDRRSVSRIRSVVGGWARRSALSASATAIAAARSMTALK